MGAAVYKRFADLLEPIDVPYTDDLAYERACELIEWYERLKADPARARGAAEMVTEDLWTWLCLVAWSIDEKPEFLPTKPAPPYRYLKELADFLEARTERGAFEHPKTILPKSRQLWVSWLAVHRMLYLALKQPNSKILIVSLTEDTGQELLQRVRAAYDLLPAALKRAWKLKPSSKAFTWGRAQFPNGSVIKVIPEAGGQKTRSYSGTLFVMDEAALQHYFDLTWAAAVAGISSGNGFAAVMAISTANTENTSFRDLAQDRKDGRRGGREKVHHQSQGLEFFRTRLTQVDVCQVHYTADPAKRTAEWKRQAKAGFLSEAQWALDMEIDFDAFSGQPIFPMFDPVVHLMHAPPWIERQRGRDGRTRQRLLIPDAAGGDANAFDVEIGLGIDHGLRNPCGALWMTADRAGDLCAYRDYSEANREASENAREIKRMTGEERIRPGWMVADAEARLPVHRKIQTIDLYRFQDGNPRKPILGTELTRCKKGPDSVSLGINRTIGLLLATLAIKAGGLEEYGGLPEERHSYWLEGGYSEKAIREFAERPSLLISPNCHALLEELKRARYKTIRSAQDGGVNQPEREVDADNHVRKPLAYLLEAGMGMRTAA